MCSLWAVLGNCDEETEVDTPALTWLISTTLIQHLHNKNNGPNTGFQQGCSWECQERIQFQEA